jgi:N-acetylglucosamine-6-sulfatase
VRWKTGERELYDLQRDPYELENVSDEADPLTIARLKTRVELLSDCRGSSCRAAEGP